MQTRFGPLEVSYSSRGTPTYRLEIWHDGLGKHRLITGRDHHVVEQKAYLQAQQWDDQWEAEQRTTEAVTQLEDLGRILEHTLHVDDTIVWEELKDHSSFPEPQPVRPSPPPEPTPLPIPPEPSRSDFRPRLTLLDRIFRPLADRKHAEAEERFQAAYAAWSEEVARIKATNEEREEEYRRAVAAAEKKYAQALAAWEQRKRRFEEQQAETNAAVDRLRVAYFNGEPEAIREYCDLVLSRSKYPPFFPQEFDLEYNPETKTVVVEYKLPSPDALPTLKEVRYAQSTGEFVEKHISDAESRRLYDSVLYQITLRTIHELFEADAVGALSAVVFNGWVRSIDRATGNEVDACVLSIQVSKDEFSKINLAHVDPKTCFKALKGVGSSSLHSLTPVAPIMQVSRDDRRFVAAREVANSLDDSVNLATIDWEDFEHLIRELFEREFATAGAEVRVTQASRDGGVDAVIFDPDPIRGGKIVVQAKRYTNTVGVAAVRDLYGTVVNEGANKGILVTTSDYGPDAYAFAKGKPLTLLNGANLLHLLEKHGHKARIDLKEAKAMARGS